MKWIKEVVVDIVVTLVIIAAVMMNEFWIELVLVVYTTLMLILRIVELSGSFSGMQQKKKNSAVPQWFYHILYAINVVVLLSFQWWITAAQWFLIWVLSWFSQRKIETAKRPSRSVKK